MGSLSVNKLCYEYLTPGQWPPLTASLHKADAKTQGFGSGSGFDPDSIRSVDPDPDPYSESGSGSKRAKITYKSRKKLRNFMF